jgi:hypothetical protein
MWVVLPNQVERGKVRSNKFAAGCAHCSVLVLAGGGFLRSGDSGWEVWCRTCDDIATRHESEAFDDLPSVPPLGCATSIRLKVFGLTLKCWQCGQDTACVAGLYPDQPSRTYVGMHSVGDDRTMALAQQLLQQSGLSGLAGVIQSRYSKTMRQRSLANCCQHCGALQGNFFVNEEAFDRVVTANGLDGLDTVVVADCPVLDWQRIVHHSCSAICV